MKVLANPQNAVLRKRLGQVTRTPWACLKEDDNTHGRAESGDPIGDGLPGTGTKWAPGNGDWLQGRQRLNPSQRDLPLIPPPPRSRPASRLRVQAASATLRRRLPAASQHPVTPFGAGAASGSLNPAAAGRGTSLPAGARLSDWLRSPGAGLEPEWERSAGRSWAAGGGVELKWRGRCLGPEGVSRIRQRFLGLCQCFCEVSDLNSRFLCEELICVYLLWGWSKLECWER